MKTTVLYHSKTGNTKKMAEAIASGMNTVDGIQAKAFSIDSIEADWITESKCVVLGSPIYLASITSDIKHWLDTECRKYGLAGKIGGAFATCDYLHGGAELGIRTILDHFLVLGMMTYSGGGSFGKLWSAYGY